MSTAILTLRNFRRQGSPAPNEPGLRLLAQKEIKLKREDLATLPLGTPFPSVSALARIVKVGGADSEDEQFKVGDAVQVMSSSWAVYMDVKKGKAISRKKLPGISLSAYLGAIGLSGAMAYWASKDRGYSRAVGNVAIQYAKMVLGVKCVVSISSSDEKCKWVKSIGMEAVNYKSATLLEDLGKATPDQVDLYFDNVSGSILDAVMTRMKSHGMELYA